MIIYLTLTSVVFEYSQGVCIAAIWVDLTLTSVVFEFSHLMEYQCTENHLTLTSVVFEWCASQYRQNF